MKTDFQATRHDYTRGQMHTLARTLEGEGYAFAEISIHERNPDGDGLIFDRAPQTGGWLEAYRLTTPDGCTLAVFFDGAGAVRQVDTLAQGSGGRSARDDFAAAIFAATA